MVVYPCKAPLVRWAAVVAVAEDPAPGSSGACMSVIVTWPLLGAVAIHNNAYVIANTQNGRTGNGVCVEAQSSTLPAVSNYKCYAPVH